MGKQKPGRRGPPKGGAKKAAAAGAAAATAKPGSAATQAGSAPPAAAPAAAAADAAALRRGGGSTAAKKLAAKPAFAVAATAAVADAPVAHQGGSISGLVNLGNTCFFNSALQVLAACPPVQEHFGSGSAAGVAARGPLGSALEESVQALTGEGDAERTSSGPKGKFKSSGGGAHNPNRLLSAVCKIAPQFKGKQQQDSHELLRVLLDGLSTEEHKARQPRSGGRDDAGKQDAEKVRSWVEAVFGGQLVSSVLCRTCGHEATTLEPFMDLSLPIPTEAEVEAARKGKSGKGKGSEGESAGDDGAEAGSAGEGDAKQRGNRLSGKDKKRLAKEARKQAKLDRQQKRKGPVTVKPAAKPAASAEPAAANAAETPAAPAAAEGPAVPAAAASMASDGLASVAGEPTPGTLFGSDKPSKTQGGDSEEEDSVPGETARAACKGPEAEPAPVHKVHPGVPSEPALVGPEDAAPNQAQASESEPRGSSNRAAPSALPPPSTSGEETSAAQPASAWTIENVGLPTSGCNSRAGGAQAKASSSGSESEEERPELEFDPCEALSGEEGWSDNDRAYAALPDASVAGRAENAWEAPTDEWDLSGGEVPVPQCSGAPTEELADLALEPVAPLKDAQGVQREPQSGASSIGMEPSASALEEARLIARQLGASVDVGSLTAGRGAGAGAGRRPASGRQHGSTAAKVAILQATPSPEGSAWDEPCTEPSPALRPLFASSSSSSLDENQPPSASPARPPSGGPLPEKEESTAAVEAGSEVRDNGSEYGWEALPGIMMGPMDALEGVAWSDTEAGMEGTELQDFALSPDLSDVYDDLEDPGEGVVLDASDTESPAAAGAATALLSLSTAPPPQASVPTPTPTPTPNPNPTSDAPPSANDATPVEAAAAEDYEGEAMDGLGSLFGPDEEEEGGGDAGPSSSGGQASEAADDWTGGGFGHGFGGWNAGAAPQISSGVTLRSCLAAFFRPEVVSWECPAEKTARVKAAETAEAEATPLGRRTVSFSEERHVKVIPGSADQRHTYLDKALRGEVKEGFRRPLRLDGEEVVIWAEVAGPRRDRLRVLVAPLGADDLARDHLFRLPQDVPIKPIEDSEDEAEQAAVQGQAQVLMDMVADLVTHEGADGLQEMAKGGLTLVPAKGGAGSGAWQVKGKLPEGLGSGNWEYPCETPHTPPNHRLASSDSIPSATELFPEASSPTTSDPSSPRTATTSPRALNFPPPDVPPAASPTPASIPNGLPNHVPKSLKSMPAGLDSDEDGSGSPSTVLVGKLDAMSLDSGSVEEDRALTLHEHPHLQEQSGSAAAGFPEAPETPTRVSETRILEAESSAQQSGSGWSGLHGQEPPLHDSGEALGDGDRQEDPLAKAAPKAHQPKPSGTRSHANCSAPAAASGDREALGPLLPTSQQASSGEASASELSGDSEAGATGEDGGDVLTPLPAAQPAANRGGRRGGLSRRTSSSSIGRLKIVQREAEKGYRIHSAPQLLTVHLKRFQQDMRGRLRKIDGAVPFDFELELPPFCDSRGPDSRGASYRLVGIVEHSGTMRGGHYIAYVRRCVPGIVSGSRKSAAGGGDVGAWFRCSDTSVRAVSQQEVATCEAYILMYCRV